MNNYFDEKIAPLFNQPQNQTSTIINNTDIENITGPILDNMKTKLDEMAKNSLPNSERDSPSPRTPLVHNSSKNSTPNPPK